MELKKKYISPNLEQVVLDNEISLALQSPVPPGGPGDEEIVNSGMGVFGNDPYKQQG